MSISKIGHYALTNPASVYDEEALTALELAGRCAGKVNEIIEEFISLSKKTDNFIEGSEDIIEKDVNNWLDSHPEATTTVLDDSLEFVKLKKGALGYVTPQMFGAVGDGVTDDTQAFIDAIGFLAETRPTLHVPCGTYLVSEDIPLKSNITVRGEGRNTVIKRAGNNLTTYGIFDIRQVENVTVKDLWLQGERNEHIGSDGEWGMCINIKSSDNVSISNCILTDGWGDGLYIGTYMGTPSNNILVENCVMDNNRRQGISIIHCDGVIIKGCHIKNTNGTLPQAGIDLETNDALQYCKNVIIENCTLENNAGCDVLIGNGMSVYEVIVRDCISKSAIGFSVYSSDNVNEGYVLYKNNTLINTVRSLAMSNKAVNNLKIYMDGCNISCNMIAIAFEGEVDNMGGVHITNTVIRKCPTEVPFRLINRKENGTFSDLTVELELMEVTRKYGYIVAPITGSIDLRLKGAFNAGNASMGVENYAVPSEIISAPRTGHCTMTLKETTPYGVPIIIRKASDTYITIIQCQSGAKFGGLNANLVQLLKQYDYVVVTHEAENLWSLRDYTHNGVGVPESEA